MKGNCYVLSSIRRLFNQYCDYHFMVPVAGFPIFDDLGGKLGHVDRISYGRDSVRIEGWSTAEKVALGPASKTVWQSPGLQRNDVTAALQLNKNDKTGFNLVSVGPTSGLIFSLKNGPTTLQIMVPAVGRLDLLKAKLHIRANFFKRSCQAFPSLLRAYVRPNTLNKARAKRALGMIDEHLENTLDDRFFQRSELGRCDEKLTLIMPIYNAFDVLCEALSRIEKNTDLPWRIILVEDCSTDARVRPMLREWCEQQRLAQRNTILLENEENQGFIGSVNRAFQEALKFDNHVVLINSDALVPQDWAQRLLHPILRDPKIASVTPLSNDAEIFNVPFICQRSDLKRGEADTIDKSLRMNLSNNVYRQAPTGVGFCMAINLQYLRKLPEFDREFGKGYGEEVDWCCKVSALGGKHVVQPSLLVEHRGGTSFGNAAKQAAIARNNQVISKRYPKYDLSVQHFIALDPIKTARIFAAMASLSAKQDVVDVYLAHSLGGGAEHYLQEKITHAKQQDRGAVVLRLGGRLRWRIEVHLASGIVCGETDSNSMMVHYLAAIPEAHIIYSCAVGDRDPSALPKIILNLVRTNRAKFTFLVHDYFAISPSYCLLDSDDVYRSAQLNSSLDDAHVATNQAGKKLTAAQWRIRWFGLLQSANSIECFSKSSADILQNAFPALNASIVVRPHSVTEIEAVHRLTSHPEPTIGVLGDIGIQKGANCVKQLSKALPKGRFQGLTVVGHVDPCFTLGRTTKETGPYKRSEISALAEHHQIAAWLIPSIWPETFSYTTHEALATGLPVFCFDLGAQSEALRNAENGYVLPLQWAIEPDLILQQISKVLDNDALRRRFHSQTESLRDRGTATQSKSAC